MVGPLGLPSVTFPVAFELGLVPVGLAKRLSLETAIALPLLPTDMDAAKGGKATLASMLLTPIATARLTAGLVLAKLLGMSGIALHVGRLGVTPT